MYISAIFSLSFCQNKLMEKYSTNKDSTLIIVTVKIDNKPFPFIFDTGSQINLLFNDGSFDLSKAKDIKILDSKNNSSKAQIVRKHIELPFFNIKSKGLCVIIESKPKLFERLNIHGILGADIINKFNWRIDTRNLEIYRINEKDIKTLDTNSYIINTFIDKNNTLSASADINNNNSNTFIFDTGYNGILSISSPRKTTTNKQHFIEHVGVESTINGDKMDTSFINLDTLRIGNFIIENIPISYYSFDDKNELNTIGMGFFKTFEEINIINSKRLIILSKIKQYQYTFPNFTDFDGKVMSQNTKLGQKSNFIIGKDSKTIKLDLINAPITKFTLNNNIPVHNIK